MVSNSIESDRLLKNYSELKKNSDTYMKNESPKAIDLSSKSKASYLIILNTYFIFLLTNFSGSFKFSIFKYFKKYL